MRKTKIGIVVLIVLAAATAWAAHVTARGHPGPRAVQAVQTGTRWPAHAVNTAAAAGREFKPSERIRAGQAVAFPADI